MEGGSSVKEGNNYGRTALLCTALSGHFEEVHCLLREGGSRVEGRRNYKEIMPFFVLP